MIKEVILMTNVEERIEQIIQVLREQVVQDTAVPRNIRRAAEQAIEALMNKEKEPAVRAADAIAILEEISEDPNMPIHTRTQIWGIVSELETLHTRTIIWEVLGALEQIK